MLRKRILRYHGFGTIYYSSKKKFVGEWYENKRFGQGIEYDENGKIEREGKWNNNNFVG